MFHLTPTAVATTLVGHLIFGFVLGLLFLRTQRDTQAVQWPWPPLLDLLAAPRTMLGRGPSRVRR
jgi:hypothetical protein